MYVEGKIQGRISFAFTIMMQSAKYINEKDMKIQTILIVVLANTFLFAEDVDMKAKEIPVKLQKFCTWWEAMIWGDTTIQTPEEVNSKEVKLNDLKRSNISNIKIPKVKLDVEFIGHELINENNHSFILIYPSLKTNSNLSDEDIFKREDDYCSLNSWIYSKNDKTLSPISELPECERSDRVFDVFLYWVGSEKKTLIQITTNSPLCVISKLYYFESKLKYWVLLKELCTD